MTASDVREKDREAADFFIASERFDELTASNMYVTLTTEAFLAGIQHARSEQEGLEKIAEAAIRLREAQKVYMNNRGNDQLGRQVGAMAQLLDEALAGWRKNGSR